jgi:hypothetical protein
MTRHCERSEAIQKADAGWLPTTAFGLVAKGNGSRHDGVGRVPIFFAFLRALRG